MRSFSVSDCREVRDDVFSRFMQENPLSQIAVDGLSVSINFYQQQDMREVFWILSEEIFVQAILLDSPVV